MWNRVLALLRARLGAQREGATFPVAALMMQGFISAVLCGLVRDSLPPFAYGVFALSVCGALVAVPLLGELSGLLTADEADEWVRSLPASNLELKLARLLHLLIALGTLTLGAALPAAALATFGLVERALLLGGALALALFIAALLLAIQSILRGRAQAPLVIAQTALLLLVVVGSTLGLRYVAAMVEWRAPADALTWIEWFPPAWFAGPLAAGPGLSWGWKLAPLLLALGSAAVLALLPPPPRESARGGQPLLSLCLTPFRRLATLLWVAREERGAFDLVYDALPKEREFVLRTYPLIALPLAFLIVDATMLPLLLFTPGVWLPILLMHVPTSSSHGARWVLDTSPVTPWALANGALKAVVVRFVLPLYALLAVVAGAVGGLELALFMAPAGFLVSVFVVRGTWTLCVDQPPLSVAPDELRVQLNLLTVLGTLAVVLSLLSIGAMLVLDNPLAAAAVTTVLLVLELAADRAWRSGRVPNPVGV